MNEDGKKRFLIPQLPSDDELVFISPFLGKPLTTEQIEQKKRQLAIKKVLMSDFMETLESLPIEERFAFIQKTNAKLEGMTKGLENEFCGTNPAIDSIFIQGETNALNLRAQSTDNEIQR